MGGRGTAASRNSGSNIEFSVENSSVWGTEKITSYEDFRNPSGVEKAVNEMKEEVKRVLELADGDIDRAYEYLADAYPFALYDDDGTKIVDNRDENNIIGVKVQMSNWDGKINVTLSPAEYSEDEFNTREELDAIGLWERRR